MSLVEYSLSVVAGVDVELKFKRGPVDNCSLQGESNFYIVKLFFVSSPFLLPLSTSSPSPVSSSLYTQRFEYSPHLSEGTIAQLLVAPRLRPVRAWLYLPEKIGK